MGFSTKTSFLTFSLFIALVASAIVGSSIEAQEKQTSEDLLPSATRAWFSVPNLKSLTDSFQESQIGQLTRDESLKPFIESFETQAREWLDEQNIKHGIKFADLEKFETGEICIAGVLPRGPGGTVTPGDHGLVLLVDVTDSIKQAEELLTKVGEKLKEKEATAETVEINGIQTTKWTMPKGTRRKQFAHHAIVENWLVSSNNENVFRHIIQRIKLKTDEENTLANSTSFKTIRRNCDLDKVTKSPHFKWYIDLFGYADLARAIAEEERKPGEKNRDNDVARIIRNAGFDAVKGIGGNLVFSTSDHEVLHRTFVYAPAVEGAGDNKYLKSAAVLDFVNRDSRPLTPMDWTPSNSASFLTFTWDLDKVLNNIHHVVDAFIRQDATANALETILQKNGVDVRRMVRQFDNQLTMIAETQQPITEESEQIVIAIRIKPDPNPDGTKPGEIVQEDIEKFFGDLTQTDTHLSYKIFSEKEGDKEVDLNVLFPEEAEEVEAEEEIFDKRFLVVAENQLFVSNNLKYLKSVLSNISNKPGEKFRSSQDYLRINIELDKIVDVNKVSLRQFGRFDQMIEANYEMLRQGKMRTSKTLLARFLDTLRTEDPIGAEHDELPKQKIDASKLPDYKAVVAPYLGPSGWVVESEEDGWRITGCVLKKKPEQVAKKIDDN